MSKRYGVIEPEKEREIAMRVQAAIGDEQRLDIIVSAMTTAIASLLEKEETIDWVVLFLAAYVPARAREMIRLLAAFQQAPGVSVLKKPVDVQ